MKKIKISFSECAQAYILQLEEQGRYSTAHVYKNAMLSFAKFCNTGTVKFEQINRNSLRQYSQHLKECGLMLNSVSTYMRMLRSIYNRGVEAGTAPYIPRLFRDVFTGIDVRQKKAISTNELHTLLYQPPRSKSLIKTQRIARLMFQFCGMPFVDFALLEKRALKNNLLRYNRIKTGTSISIELLDSSKLIIDKLRNYKASNHLSPDYLFNIMKGNNTRNEIGRYHEYQAALRSFNNQLKKLSQELDIKTKITSYSIRHSWATNAKFRGIPIEMISESLGHKSIKTTQIYLKGFELEQRTEANKLSCFYIENYKNQQHTNTSI